MRTLKYEKAREIEREMSAISAALQSMEALLKTYSDVPREISGFVGLARRHLESASHDMDSYIDWEFMGGKHCKADRGV